MNRNGYQQYKEQSVTTMTRGEMLLLLYDELIKRLTRAELSLKQENYELFDQSAARCMEIVAYLKNTLSMQYDISRQLMQMYDFFLYELSRIKAGRDIAVINELKPLVVELRDAFRGAQTQVTY